MCYDSIPGSGSGCTILFSEVTLDEMGHQIWARGGLGEGLDHMWNEYEQIPASPFWEKLKKPRFYYKNSSKLSPQYRLVWDKISNFFSIFSQIMVPRFQNWKKKYFEIFFQIFSRFWNFGALFIVKQRFLKQTFLKKGWLGFAHIRSTCGPDLPRARHALRFDAPFCQGLPRKKVWCVGAGLEGVTIQLWLDPESKFPIFCWIHYVIWIQ